MENLNQTTIRASHIAIGTELTSGQTLNTNSRLIAEHLQEAGIRNQIHVVVPDNNALILKTFDFIALDADWIFVYGGLGPTTDDFTRNVVSEWSERDLVPNEDVWTHIQNILKSRGYPVREFQKQQAFFPAGAKIMENTKGTAHGFHLHAKGKEIFVLPGPPKEVQSVFENYLKAWVDTHALTSNSQIVDIWNTIGLGESEVAFQIEKLVKDYDVTVGYRVHLPYVEVKIVFFKSQQEYIQPLINLIQEKLKPILVYKKKYPYPDYFKNLFESFQSISIVDEVSQGGIVNDLKEWISNWGSKKINYFNHVPEKAIDRTETILSSEILPNQIFFSVIKMKMAVLVKLTSSNLNLRFEISLEPLAKMPEDRKPLFIKELIYKELMARTK